jgi:D-alanyl-D-alanine carboxypeptidase (penicillin-binding protein 5/6)
VAQRERNRVVIAAVAVLIVGGAVYGSIAMLAPLPSTAGAPLPAGANSSTTEATAPALPVDGSSAVTLGTDAVQVSAGSADPVPMAAATKIITALVVLDVYPLGEGLSGPSIPVTAEDFAAFATYQREGTRAVRVVTGDQWSEREALQAMLIASSNNHAEMLARWAFGSIDNYLDAADGWLTENGLSDTHAADATGLSPDSVATGGDLARLAAIAMADPLIAEIVETPRVTTLRGATFENTIAYRGGEGLLGISRSYTDEAGVCLLFAYPTEIGGQATTVYGAFLGEPSYDQLDADVDALITSLSTSLGMRDLVTEGKPYGTYRTEWGTVAAAVARETIEGVTWDGHGADTNDITLDDVTSARSGTRVGTLRVSTVAGEESVALVLDASISDPGPVWRLSHPGTVVPKFVEMISGTAD